MEVALSREDAVPAGHEVQKTEPFVADHDPAAQGTQTLEPVPLKVPAGQSKHPSIDIALETALKKPAGHEVQDAWPVDGLNVPAGHEVQAAAPPVLKVPTGQEVQAAEELLPVDGL